jgi:TolB protein
MKAGRILLVGAAGLMCPLMATGCPSRTSQIKVLFAADRDGNMELYLVGLNGADPQNLTEDAADNVEGAVTPDSSQVVFTSSPHASRSSLVRIDLDGTGRATLIDDGNFNRSPIITPNGSRVVFVKETPTALEIWSMTLAGTDLVLLASGQSADVDLAVSPDGSRVAFSFADGIGAVDVEGADPVTLSDAGYWPVYSPDGSRIAYTRTRPGTATLPGYRIHDVCIMDADGSDPVKISQSPGNNYWPRFSPDGDEVLYHSENGSKIELRVVNPDGTGDMVLTDQAAWLNPASWSPGGDAIAFISRGQQDVMIVRPDGTGLTNLTNGAGPNESPVWTPDSQKILYHSFQNGHRDVYWVPAEGGEQVNITPDFDGATFVQFVLIRYIQKW